MGIVAWELYHLDCYRQWPELPEVTIKSWPRNTARSSRGDRTRAPAHHAGTPVTACSRVFGISELAEEIFLQLAPLDLLCRAQRVCQQWRMIIQTTRTIREHLFMDSISHIRPRLIRTRRAPMLSTEQPNSWAENEQLGVSRTILENPFLPLLSVDEPWPEPFARSEASWRKMLITQPGISRMIWHGGGSIPLEYAKSSSHGLLMGEVGNSRAAHAICGWSAWTAYEDHHQLKALKTEMRLSHDRLREMYEWSCATEIPEYEVWEEKTGQSMQLRL